MSTKQFVFFPFLRRSLVLLLAVVLAFGATGQAKAGPSVRYVYVNINVGGGLGDGSSWANAYKGLRDALPAKDSDEIWVAAGTYEPTGGSDRTLAFNLQNNVAIYGGFAGGETKRTQRDPKRNVTILSGEIGVSGIADNSYHVVSGNGVDKTAILDGFTITAGNANGTNLDNDGKGGGIFNWKSSPTLANLVVSTNTVISDGGGMYNYVSDPNLTNVTFRANEAGNNGGGIYNISNSPTLTGVTLTENFAQNSGGGMYNSASLPVLTNVTISYNTVGGAGGGMYNSAANPNLNNVVISKNAATSGAGMYNNTSTPKITDVTISQNTAVYGGGMYNDYSNPNVKNTTFSSNNAGRDGGAMYNLHSSPTLTNATFSGNQANHTGGMYNVASSNPSLTNVTFSGNVAADETFGVAMFNHTSSPQIKNSIFWGNESKEFFNATGTTSLADSIVAGGCPANSTCTNVINTNPALGALANNGGLTNTMALGAGSAAIDAGNNATCALTDQRGIARPQGAKCDLGAFEFVYW